MFIEVIVLGNVVLWNEVHHLLKDVLQRMYLKLNQDTMIKSIKPYSSFHYGTVNVGKDKFVEIEIPDSESCILHGLIVVTLKIVMV